MLFQFAEFIAKTLCKSEAHALIAKLTFGLLSSTFCEARGALSERGARSAAQVLLLFL